MLANELPPSQNVYRTFRPRCEQGKFESMHDRLRTQWRERERREASPKAAAPDAQSTRSAPQRGESSHNVGKKLEGRERHVVVDTLGLWFAVSVTAASVQDRYGARPVIASIMAEYPGIETLLVDPGDTGQCAQTISRCPRERR